MTSVGVIAGMAIGAYAYFLPASWGQKHEAQHRVNVIFEYVEQAQRGGPAPWICESIDREWLILCSEIPGHALCQPGTLQDIKRRAGC